jgi:quinol monooxygenase YgiN
MSDVVSWVVEFAIKPGQLGNFKAVVEEMVQSTRNEPDTQAYEWFLSEDDTTCHVCERYADSTATMAHLGTFGEKFAERLLNTADLKRFTVYSAPNEEVKSLLGGFGAVFMGQLNGFAR